ncbi:M56 family metallopeptidase [Sinosporangium siamense]|uniref:Peptidase M48 n=1 Tax=Sinosporangium siamense TaxID=1367973 RepID=A0A919RQH3_9ACTN|nr:M56 family metallopeptidase [Sinosporangium siamense]GII96809.1 peptidase M48 [Sinosporangium siamense]
MSLEIYLPVALLSMTTMLLAWRQPRMHPAWHARVLAVLIGATALAVLGVLVFIIMIALGPLERTNATVLGRVLIGHEKVPSPVAAVVCAILLMIGVAVARTVAKWRRELRTTRALGTGVVADVRPFALAVPGRDGGVILSSGLVGMLSRRELEVVLRHEIAHMKHRHHLYLVIGTIATRIFPPLIYPHRALCYAVERWADEEAAVAVGDRTLTARTIARVALAQSPAAPGPSPALTGSHVSRRVLALMGQSPPDNRISGPVLLSGAWMATGSAISPALSHQASLLLVLL